MINEVYSLKKNYLLKYFLIFLLSVIVAFVASLLLTPFIVEFDAVYLYILGVVLYAAIIIFTINILTNILKAPARKSIRFMYVAIGIIAIYFFCAFYFDLLWWYIYDYNVITLVFSDVIFYIRDFSPYFFDFGYQFTMIVEFVGLAFTEGIETYGIVWIISFITVPLGIALIPSKALALFDEDSNSWYKERIIGKYFYLEGGVSLTELETAVKNDDFSLLLNESQNKNKTVAYQIVTYYNNQHELTNLLRVDSLSNSGNNVKRKTVIQPLYVSESTLKKIADYVPQQETIHISNEVK